VIDLLIDRRTLPKGGSFKAAVYETRQEIDMTISRFVTEYRIEVLEDSQGHRFTAAFPEALKWSVQHGNNIKAHSVYMSQFQLVPVDRVRYHFADQMGWRDSKTGQRRCRLACWTSMQPLMIVVVY